MKTSHTQRDQAPWDVAVIGAGPSGLFATERLRAAGLNTLLLEAGRRERRKAETAPKDPRWRFRSLGANAQWRRAHGVGGGTLLWGGWASRFTKETFEEGSWPYHAEALEHAYTEAERWLGVVEGPLAPRYLRAAQRLELSISPRRSATLCDQAWTARFSPAARTAKIETAALALDLQGDTAQRVYTTDPNGHQQEIEAKAFVLAASPIESCRLLLASGVKHPRLGRNFVDQVRVGYLLVEPRGEPPSLERGSSPEAALVSYASRGCRFSIELVGPRPLSMLGEERLSALGLGLRRGARHTLITALGQLSPHPERYLDLAIKTRDSFGRPIPRVHLAWSRQERQLIDEMKRACVSLAAEIASPGADLILYSDPLQAPSIFQPAGLCAMGRTEASVCDPQGRLWSARNVFIADASVFPSAGDGHPTLTVLAHAARMTDALLGQRQNRAL